MPALSDQRVNRTNGMPASSRRSYFLGVFNGAAFTFAETLISADLVLTNFISKLTTSNFLIGLVVPLRDASWYLPQLLVSSYLQYRDRALPLYRRLAILRSATWLGMAVIVFAVRDRNPAILLLLFYALYTVYSLASGFAGLSFMDVVAKTIPSRRRGAFFGGRLFFGSLLGLAASALVDAALGGTLGFPYFTSMALLMFVSWIVATVGLAAFAIIHEPAGEVRQEPSTLQQHVRRAARLPRANRDFRLFLGGRAFLLLAYVAAPFYGVYATRELGADDRVIAVFLAARTITFLVANPIWARASDRRGNRIVILAASAVGVFLPVTALAARPMLELVGAPVEQWGFLYVPVFVLWGLFESGMGVGANNLLLDLAPSHDRSIYVGLTNSVLGVTLLCTTFGGVLVDLVGISGVFVVATACYISGVVAIARMREPRSEIEGEELAG